jgi:hypothetical protein
MRGTEADLPRRLLRFLVPYPKLSLANHCQRIKHPKYAFANQHGHIRRCISSLAGGLLFVQQKRPSAQPGANLGYCFSARIIVMPPTSPFYEIYRASGYTVMGVLVDVVKTLVPKPKPPYG